MNIRLRTTRPKPSPASALSTPKAKDFSFEVDPDTASRTSASGYSGLDQCNTTNNDTHVHPIPKFFFTVNNERDHESGAKGYVAVDSVPQPPSVPKHPPVKPDQTKMKGAHVPKCLASATRGHKKCKEAFDTERERAEYAASQANAMSKYAHQYHAQLVETQEFMHNQNKSLMLAVKEIAGMKVEHAGLADKLTAAAKGVNELEAEAKEKKDLEAKLTAKVEELVHRLEEELFQLEAETKEKKDLEAKLTAKEEELVHRLEEETFQMKERDARLKEVKQELSDTKKKLNEKEEECKAGLVKATELAKLASEGSDDRVKGKHKAANKSEARTDLVDYHMNNMILEQAANENMNQLSLQQNQDVASVHWKARVNDLVQTVNALKGGNAGVMANNMGEMMGANDIGSGAILQGGSWDPTGMLSMMNQNRQQPQQQQQQQPQTQNAMLQMKMMKQQMQQMQQQMLPVQQQQQQMQPQGHFGMQHFDQGSHQSQQQQAIGLVNPMNANNLVISNGSIQQQPQQRSLSSSLFGFVYD